MRTFALMMLWFCCALYGVSAAKADEGHYFSLELEPAAAAPGAPVVARVRTKTCLQAPPEGEVARDGRSLNLRIDAGDQCYPADQLVNERRYALGALPAGDYTIALEVCTGRAPPGFARCHPEVSVELRVDIAFERPGGVAVPVPAVSAGPIALMVVALLLVTARRRRDRRR